ncbi:TRAP-type C4-dicarboxylate transport system, substrate-binding protein [Thalassobacillus cyri]|uniref:TRAP-type C4-dicarboxylate transport system, substrate-binding protein n=1 Tax=Thalassobacillus cyri TaxID=571932 RepID=A0A1H4A8P9_9BACI|nr:TRAP transporter substrate-binding protein DctP [Thalassobacillus cyri]SEA32280.1 TRAP-type C4-dicarboxylate transport system, substrate-binding protein [Thalassobacillus cyri]
MKLKSKRLSTLVLGVSALFLAGCGVEKGSSASGGNVIEMNVNNTLPSTHHAAKNVYEPWKELVEEKTDGRVKVNLYHGGTLGSSASTLEDLQGGVYDVGTAIGSYFYDSALFPYTIGLLPYAFPNAETGTKVLDKFSKEVDIEVENVKVLGGVASDLYNLFSTKPIEKLEDLDGLKMRVQGKGDDVLAKSWGATPVSIKTDATYEGLEKGMIDVTPYTTVGVMGTKFYEVAPYVTKTKYSSTIMIPIMSESFYNRLPDDLKKLFDEELNPKLVELYAQSYIKESKKANKDISELVADKGKVIELTTKELNKFKEKSMVQWEEWVKDANERGYDGESMLAEFKKILKEEGVEAPK